MIDRAAGGMAKIEGIPQTYEELFQKYGPFIANETRRLNVVAGNFDDLYQTICERLIHAKALEKFGARILKSSDEDVPDTMTGEDACKLLGIKFPAWRSKQWSYHKVFKGDLAGQIPVEGKTHGTISRFNEKTGKKAVVSWVAWMPEPIVGVDANGKKLPGYGSPNALFKTSDVLEVPACGYFPKMNFDTAAWPKRKVLPHHFMGYLGRAIRNNWYNFCRTIRRKHRDRTGDCFAQFKTPDGDFNDNWEDTLPDTDTSCEDVENALDYRHLVEDEAKITEIQKGEIGHLLKSHSIVEAITLSSLSAAQKRILLSATVTA